MISVPKTMAQAAAEIDRLTAENHHLTERLAERDSELDNVLTFHFDQCRVAEQQARELKEYRALVKELRAQVDNR